MTQCIHYIQQTKDCMLINDHNDHGWNDELSTWLFGWYIHWFVAYCSEHHLIDEWMSRQIVWHGWQVWSVKRLLDVSINHWSNQSADVGLPNASHMWLSTKVIRSFISQASFVTMYSQHQETAGTFDQSIDLLMSNDWLIQWYVDLMNCCWCDDVFWQSVRLRKYMARLIV